MKYKRVIASQPASLTHTLSTVSAQIEKLDPALFNHPTLCIAGIGASHEAAVVLAAELRTRGASAVCRRASEAMRDGVREAVMLLISVSGRSVEPLAILRNNDEAICISLTRAGDDPLAKEANAAMSFECGEDFDTLRNRLYRISGRWRAVGGEICGGLWFRLGGVAGDGLRRAARNRAA